MRLTPSGQRGGDRGHSHGHLQNWGREDVSSSGSGVKAIVVGAEERACRAIAQIKGAARQRFQSPKGCNHLSIFIAFKMFT